MPEKIKDVRPPRGLVRLVFRLPIWFYRLGLGGLLGTRFLLLTHTGRRSGLPRRTVLEVIRYDRESETFVVAAGFGPGSDWYRNVRRDPRGTAQGGENEHVQKDHDDQRPLLWHGDQMIGISILRPIPSHYNVKTQGSQHNQRCPQQTDEVLEQPDPLLQAKQAAQAVSPVLEGSQRQGG
jgi:deazaflavin-dependent oxidoreductase (nitroreductase family)